MQIKMQALILFFAAILLTETAFAQTSSLQHTWIFFSNKNKSFLGKTNSQQLGISERALKRRAKIVPPNSLVDDYDLPVSDLFISQIRQTGASIRHISRWFNAVSVEGTSEQIQAITKLLPVASTKEVAVFNRPKPILTLNISSSSAAAKKSHVARLVYDSSETQLANMKAIDLHSIGVTGVGVLIGMLDDGFNYHSRIAALKNAHVIAEYDFVYKDSNTTRESWEGIKQGNHGTSTFSVIAANDTGNMIGAAFGASFALGKTENDSSETHIEEDNYVAGLEWLERLGAEIVSTSLGYKKFDATTYRYWYKDLDGKTTIVAKAASIAARKGVLLVTAMGNEGYIVQSGDSFLYADTTLSSPADADSIIAVGATSADKILATFSGTGPSADGRIKPELVAQGESVYCVDPTVDNGFEYLQGTSFSTPLTAGAAALVLSAHPELTPMQLREALIKTADHVDDGTSYTSSFPNNFYGHGYVNALEAAIYFGPVFSNVPSIVQKTSGGFTVTTKVLSKFELYSDSIFYFYRFDSTSAYSRVQMLPTNNVNEYSASIPASPENIFPKGYFSAREKIGTPKVIPAGYKLLQNYPNPFNSITTVRFEVPAPSTIEIAIYDLLGRHVKTLLHSFVNANGVCQWDGNGENGRPVTSGVYFARLKSTGKVSSIKMILVK